MRLRPTLRLLHAAAFGALLLGALLERVHTHPGGGTLWRIAVMPDTQKYTLGALGAGMPGAYPEYYGLHLQTQADVLAAVHDAVDIAFVLHEGDIVESQYLYDPVLKPNPATDEWAFARAEMAKLDGKVGWCAAAGNHDLSYPGAPLDLTPDASEYLAHFGPAAYAGQPGYVGSSASGRGHAHVFPGGPYDFLSLVLPFEPSDAELAWAQTTLDANPCLPAVLTTHAYLRNLPGYQGHSPDALTPGGNSGVDIWEKLVRPNEQLFLVFGGHYHQGTTVFNSGEYHQVSTNDAGLPVYEMLANYQDLPEGGSGFLRIVSFEIGAGAPDRISVLTYSTSHPSWWVLMNDADSLFSFDLDFSSRFGLCDGGGAPR
ncbi:MAG: metallophosphoesterase [Planctomycetota bacterium]